jgi:hypothetical protein
MRRRAGEGLCMCLNACFRDVPSPRVFKLYFCVRQNHERSSAINVCDFLYRRCAHTNSIWLKQNLCDIVCLASVQSYEYYINSSCPTKGIHAISVSGPLGPDSIPVSKGERGWRVSNLQSLVVFYETGYELEIAKLVKPSESPDSLNLRFMGSAPP